MDYTVKVGDPWATYVASSVQPMPDPYKEARRKKIEAAVAELNQRIAENRPYEDAEDFEQLLKRFGRA